jgi:hypothetical protein
MPYRRRTVSDRRRIREVFLRPRAMYSVDEAAGLLRLPASTIRTALENGIVTALEDGGETAIGWEDVVVLGLELRWTPRMLAEALSGRRVHVLPPLVRVAAKRVVLPSYQWKVLRVLAAQKSKEEEREITVSDLLEEAVSTAVLMAIDDWTSLEASQPGLRAAAAWPTETWPRRR